MDKNTETNDSRTISSDALTELGQVCTILERRKILPINIIGEIEGHTELGSGQKATKYEHIIPLIIEAEQNDDVEGVLFTFNTMGGDVEAGLALSELIAGMTKPCVTLVLGGGHSIGVPLAVAADYSFISPTGMMTVHPIRTNGLVVGVAQSFDYLKRMQERIVKFVTTHSSIDEQSLLDLMLNTEELANDVGSILIGEQAVKAGIINEVGSLGAALKKLGELIEAKSALTK